MPCDEYKRLLMAYIDEEISDGDRLRLEEHLRGCAECRAELDGFRHLKEVTDDMKFNFPEERLWATYWSGVYNRLERGVAWVLLSLGTIILVVYGIYELIELVVGDMRLPWPVKLGAVFLLAGIVALFVSTVRERIFAMKSDRYKEVER